MVRELLYALLFGALAASNLPAVTYTVKKGDTLYGLGRAHGVSVDEITKANPGLNARSLTVGRNIEIPDQPGATVSGTNSPPPAPAVRLVKKGDTLTAIAKQYQVTVSDLMAWNKLASPQINIGQKLKVTAPPPALTATTATASGSARPPAVIRPAPEKYLFVSRVRKQIDAPKISRQWKYIVVHHSGSRRGNAAIFEYDHRQRGMENGLAYHFIIGNGTDSGDGEIEVGGRWRRQVKGGHLRTELTENGVELNETAVGICLVGDFERDRPTRKQIAAVIELVNYLNRRVTAAGYARPRFTVHKVIHPRHTDCPGKNFPTAALFKMFGAGAGGGE
ncbi:MAG: LysM peptidoglycan-binding domain-containing protein [Verrucomicrobiales bacterium]|jgi:LysM repeat protein|nr:LysM peptidoglycan-binding domain-containing protein [Verrucomicrobiales bacterium]